MTKWARGSVPVERLEKLAPCECGRPAKLQGTQIVEGRATRWYARCELATCWFGPERDSPERAAESWNRRALLAEAREEGKPLYRLSAIRYYAAQYESGNMKADAAIGMICSVLSDTPPASAGTEGLRDALKHLVYAMSGLGQEYADGHFCFCPDRYQNPTVHKAVCLAAQKALAEGDAALRAKEEI